MKNIIKMMMIGTVLSILSVKAMDDNFSRISRDFEKAKAQGLEYERREQTKVLEIRPTGKQSTKVEEKIHKTSQEETQETHREVVQKYTDEAGNKVTEREENTTKTTLLNDSDVNNSSSGTEIKGKIVSLAEKAEKKIENAKEKTQEKGKEFASWLGALVVSMKGSMVGAYDKTAQFASNNYYYAKEFVYTHPTEMKIAAVTATAVVASYIVYKLYTKCCQQNEIIIIREKPL